jgi:hypothetical protein
VVWLAFPPVFGSGENLGDSYGSASPADCVGAVYTTQKTAYKFADVRNVASEMWGKRRFPGEGA